jgi:hypothetical protein
MIGNNVASNPKTLFISFGDGTEGFSSALRRIKLQAGKTTKFTNLITLNNKDLTEIYSPYRHFQKNLSKLDQRPKFFRASKTFLISAALEGKFGEYDAVLYADPGCEIISNYRSNSKLTELIEQALHTGGYAEQLEALEISYSKKSFLSSVNATEEEKFSGQVQATFSIWKFGRSQLDLAREWMDWSNPELDFWQHPHDNLNEDKLYIDHRNDQSLFSILWKRSNYSKGKVSRNFNGMRDLLRSAGEPIHTLRNRTGETTIPGYYNWTTTALASKLICKLDASARR